MSNEIQIAKHCPAIRLLILMISLLQNARSIANDEFYRNFRCVRHSPNNSGRARTSVGISPVFSFLPIFVLRLGNVLVEDVERPFWPAALGQDVPAQNCGNRHCRLSLRERSAPSPGQAFTFAEPKGDNVQANRPMKSTTCPDGDPLALSSTGSVQETKLWGNGEHDFADPAPQGENSNVMATAPDADPASVGQRNG